jgi:hypothetical protein
VNKASTVKHETAERARAASVSSEREAGTEARIEKAGLEPSAPSTSTPWPVLAAATLPRDGLPVHSPLAEGVDIDDIEGAAYFVFDAPDEQDADVVEVLNTASLDTRDYLVTWTDGPEVRELFKAAGLTVFTIDGADDRIFGASYPVEDHAWLHKDAEEERKRELHAKWSKLINMSASEIKRFLDSEDGKDAGMSAGAARAAGIGRGRDSARAIIRMLGNGRGVEQALENWSAGDWRWAGRQVSFISRMKGNSGPLYDDKKRMTRKLKSLLVWGHDPRKSGASKADEDPKTPADPDERRSGSSRNKPGSSSSASSGAGIKVTEAIETDRSHRDRTQAQSRGAQREARRHRIETRHARHVESSMASWCGRVLVDTSPVAESTVVGVRSRQCVPQTRAFGSPEQSEVRHRQRPASEGSRSLGTQGRPLTRSRRPRLPAT